MEEQRNGQNNPQIQQTDNKTGDAETVVQLEHNNQQSAVIQPTPVAVPEQTPQPQSVVAQAQTTTTQSSPLPSEVVSQPHPLPQQPQPTQPTPQEYKYQSGNLQPAEGYKEQPREKENKQNQPGDSVSWSASEFILHEKTSGWHLLVGLGSIVLAVAIYFLTKSIFGAITIVIVGVIVSVFGNLKPKVLDYAIDPQGIAIGDKHYEYLLFRSFAVIDGTHPYLQLMPQKRFAVPITIYFAPADGDHIIEVLGEYLPFEHRERDVVDKMSARLRF